MLSIIDLHVHSTNSDGTLTTNELVIRAKKNGLSAFALTDHDTISGVNDCIQSGKEEGIEIIAGVEISCDYGFEVHIVGLFIDYKSKLLNSRLVELINQRNIRNLKMIKRLNDIGVDISISEVEKMANGEVIARPHFARVLIDKGYAKDIQNAFDIYLKSGKPGYAERENKLTPQEAINLIKEAGGISIFAHPYVSSNSTSIIEGCIKTFKEYGLDGVEVYHSNHTLSQSNKLLFFVEKYSLLISGGSDFHGDNKSDIDLGFGKNNLKLEYDVLEKMKEYLDK